MFKEGSSLKKSFFQFVIPSVMAQWVFALYTMVDGIFVARGVSETALSAVNISMPFVTLLFSISLLFATGTSTIVAILFGQGEQESANKIYTQNIVTIIITSVLVMAAVLPNLNSIALFLGATDATLDYVKQYIGTIAYFSVFFMGAYTFEVLVKTDGKPKLSIIFVTAGALLNCVLDYVMVFVFKWGIFGAAFATGLSQAVVVVLYLIYFLGPKAGLKFKRFHFSGNLLWKTVKLGTPSGITEFSAGIVIFLFNNAIITHIGEQEVVSYTIVAYVSTIIVMSVTGIAQGFQPLVSFYYGQKDPHTCRKLLRYGIISAIVFSAAVFIPVWIFAGNIVAVFVSPELNELRKYSTEVFRTFSISFLLVWVNVIIGGYLTAVERETSAMLIALGRGFGFIALSLFVLTQLFGGAGIWWAATVSEILCMIMTLWLFHSYKRQTS